ncbi:uncharacterized protein LOC107017198 [Solanum pennellii]|uniref:Uncharacterized protein LOC107017198 n=1 Tax=Solanum pennellii TaxID=28526 RepID=A0ABM1GLQ0_SOLPN|nr:uncharacterized protein LOC107017198 [Solanum pennellii]
MKTTFVLLLLLTMAVLVCSISYDNGGTSTNTPGMEDNELTVIIKNRKLQGYVNEARRIDEAGKINLEDYRPIDPAPSSKASVRPGPIQHGTPLMPYIPKQPSPPPPRSNPVGFP